MRKTNQHVIVNISPNRGGHDYTGIEGHPAFCTLNVQRQRSTLDISCSKVFLILPPVGLPEPGQERSNPRPLSHSPNLDGRATSVMSFGPTFILVLCKAPQYVDHIESSWIDLECTLGSWIIGVEGEGHCA